MAAWAVRAPSAHVVVVAAFAVLVAGGAGSRRPRLALSAVVVALVAASGAWRAAEADASPLVELAQRRTLVVSEALVAVDARTTRPLFGGEERSGTVVGLTVLRTTRVAGRAAGEEPSGESVSGRDAVVAFLDGTHEDLLVGRRVRLTGRLVPGEGDDRLVLQVIERSASAPAAWWWESSAAVRAGVREATAHTGRAPSALVPALVTGDDADLPDDVEAEFRRTGLTHLLAVSGTNLTIVLALVLTGARACRAPPRVLAALGVLSVVAFVLVARPDPSVLRAAGMGLVALGAAGLGSRGGVRVLAVAVIALVTLSPALARAPGFVLSVCATGGILVAAPPLTRRLSVWLPQPAAVALAVPLAAQAACTPAIAALSGEVSLIAVAANVLAAPVVAPATVCGLLGGVLALAWPAGGAALGSLAGWCARWIVAVADRLAALPGAALTWTAPWWWLLVLTPLLLLVLWHVARRRAVVLGLVLGLAVALCQPPRPGWPPQGWLLVSCDVGQGDATVLRAGPDSAVVVDTGPAAPDVDRCLTDLGVRSVPALVITHADADHLAGWRGVVEGRGVEHVVVGRPARELPDRPVVTVAAGDSLEVGDVAAQVLWPPATAVTGEPAPEERNGASVVLRVQIGSLTALLTGDLGESEQDRLLARVGDGVRADVLKVAHHGSADTSARFVAAVDAAVATVSVGADNTFGHPAPEALAMLHEQGARVWRTDESGDVAVVADGDRLRVVTRH